MTEYLSLKWGTVKAWSGLSEMSQEILRRFFADGMSMSAMTDRPDDSRKAILCELIDQLDGEIDNDWSGESMTKDGAKNYVNNYRDN